MPVIGSLLQLKMHLVPGPFYLHFFYLFYSSYNSSISSSLEPLMTYQSHAFHSSQLTSGSSLLHLTKFDNMSVLMILTCNWKQRDSNPQPLGLLTNTQSLNGWNFIYKLSGCGFESRCCHLNFRYGTSFEQGVPWHSDKL